MSGSGTPPRGLLSKVVKFVRHPTTPWSQLDEPDERAPENLSKEALKDLVARKKRNDAIRQREFNMLRQLRNHGGGVPVDSGGPQSFMPSGLPSDIGEERERTLRKIDEIEAQMSVQWRGSKPSMPAGGRATAPGAGADPYERTVNLPRGGGRAPDHPPETAGAALPAEERYASTVRAVGREQPPAARPEPVAWPAAPENPPGPAPARPVAVAVFMGSQSFNVEVAELAHDPELEEAAIRFANGDDDAAERALLDAVAPGGARHGHLESWLALFDFYRATGAQARFDATALDFARQLGRSAPQWLSLPDRVEHAASTLAAAQDSAGDGEVSPDWVASERLDEAALRDLAHRLPGAGRVRLDWSALREIVPSAAPGLCALFARLCECRLHVEFVGGDLLVALLKEATPTGRADPDPVWWRLRMEACRVMDRDTDFEWAALDYCVTYEVSPPSWEKPHGSFAAVESPSSAVVRPVPRGTPGGGGPASRHDLLIVAAADTGAPEPGPVRLVGRISEADLPTALARIDARAGGAERLVIDCAELLRVDFVAAGGLLNWVLAHEAAGRAVEFLSVHRLLVPLFSVIGIAERAAVIPRAD